MSGLPGSTMATGGVGVASAITGAGDESTVCRATTAWEMQQVVQQWWCDVNGLLSSPPHSPVSQPVQLTHGSPPASGSAARPAVAPSTTKAKADNAASAVARVAVRVRWHLTRRTIVPGNPRVNRVAYLPWLARIFSHLAPILAMMLSICWVCFSGFDLTVTVPVPRHTIFWSPGPYASTISVPSV